MDIEVLKRAYEREKERRKQAEKLLEEKSRELYLSYEKLDKSHQQLEQTHADLHKQKEELVQLINAYASVTNDLQLAAKLQSDLLPEPLETSTVAATGYFLPALFVAGDAYDFFMLSDDVLALYIIDVEGHGTASAMTSFAIHSQLNPKPDGICKRTLQHHSNHSDASKEAYGKERLIELLEQTKSHSRSDCINTIKGTLVDWNGSEEFTDDVTMVIVDYAGNTK